MPQPAAPADEPLVSILTPVYNGEAFLAECIESVLAQTYRNWEYILVDNCSTDRTAEIVGAYARVHPRIRMVANTVFVNADENHNIAFRQIAPSSRFTKVISADDRLRPDCVARMVSAAVARPTVGLVGCLQQSGDKVLWTAVPGGADFLPGRDAARLMLLQSRWIFGPPTACLYRSDLVRRRPSFFPHTRPHADTSVCYECMKESDFAFIHEVLCDERVHEGQQTSRLAGLMAGEIAFLEDLLEYGPVFLTPEEFESRRRDLLDDHYRQLGRRALKLRGLAFWRYQRQRMDELGCPIDWGRVAGAALGEAWHAVRHPMETVRKLARHVS